MKINNIDEYERESGNQLLPIGRSKSGLPVLTECGGGHTNTGGARVVAGPQGERLKPLYAPRRGYANADHAAFVAREGVHILRASRDRQGIEVDAFRIVGFAVADGDPSREYAIARPVGSEFERDGTIPEELHAAADAARAKAACYHCREAHFIAAE